MTYQSLPNEGQIGEIQQKLRVLVKNALIDATDIPVLDLWTEVEAVLDRLSQDQQLLFLGNAIAILAEICALKSQQFWDDWQNQDRSDGPSITPEMVVGLFRQSMNLDISDLVKPKRNKPRQTTPPHPDDSVIGVVEKATLLTVVDAIAERDKALAVAHEEDIAGWGKTIRLAIAQWQPHDGRISLQELQKRVSKPLVEVWLALLLGGWELESDDEFYGTDIWIKLPL